MDFTTRMFLRDYAFLERFYGKKSHRSNFQFAALATSSWMIMVAFVGLTLFCVAFRKLIPDLLEPWTAPKWVLATECVSVVVIVGNYVDRKVKNFRQAGRPAIVDDFNTKGERIKWWATTLSAIPLAATFGALVYAMTRH